jgi:transcriptional regulator with XRE-family HTH domain
VSDKKPPFSDYVLHYLGIVQLNVAGLRGRVAEKKFGKKVGLSRTTIRRLEEGENFKISTLLKIAEKFGILPYELFMTDEEKLRIKGELNVYRKSLIDEAVERAKKEMREEINK